MSMTELILSRSRLKGAALMLDLYMLVLGFSSFLLLIIYTFVCDGL